MIANEILMKYVEAGNAILAKEKAKQAERERLAAEAAALKWQRYVGEVLAAVTDNHTIPADLVEFVDVIENNYSDFPRLTLDLPDCDLIRFEVCRHGGKLNGMFEVLGEPVVVSDDDGEYCVFRYGNEDIAHLPVAIATAYRRHQREIELEIELENAGKAEVAA